MEEQQYYVLAASETAQKNHRLWFVAKQQISYGEVTDNINHALLTTTYVADHEDEIYIKKEYLNTFVYATIEKNRYVDNTKYTRNKLGLKYKDGKLVRATGAGVEEDYVLLLDRASEEGLTLQLMGHDNQIVVELDRASIEEEPLIDDSMYIPKSKAEALATKFPNGSLILLNCEQNLEELGLEYVGGVLCKKEEKAAVYYAVCLNETKVEHHSVRFEGELGKTTNLSKATEYTAPLKKGSEWSYFVPKDLVDELSSWGYLTNTTRVLKQLGLHYNEEGLLRAIQEEEEEEEEEAPKAKKEPEIEYPSITKIALNLYSLYQEFKKAKNLISS